LPSSSPPQRPSWNADKDVDVTLLRNISDVIHADEAARAEDMPIKMDVRSLVFQRPGGPHCCFGLALGVLVPIVLATLIVLRSTDLRDTGLGRGNQLLTSSELQGSNATKQQGFADSEAEEHSDGSVYAWRSRKHVSADGMETGAPLKTSGSTEGVLSGTSKVASTNTSTVSSALGVDLEKSAKGNTIAGYEKYVSTTKQLAAVETSSASFLSTVKTDSITATPAKLRGSTRIQSILAKGADADAKLAVARSGAPWYSYLVYVLSVMIGLAWVSLAVNECLPSDLRCFRSVAEDSI